MSRSHGWVAARVAARKAERPDLYCRDCQWMTGGGQCPRHGGGAWSRERQAEADAKSRAPRPEEVDLDAAAKAELRAVILGNYEPDAVPMTGGTPDDRLRMQDHLGDWE